MCKDLHPNTGTWLLNRDEFLTWKSATDSSVLWLHGIPGCGKSKLVAHVINHMSPLMDSSMGSFAYFYCLRDAAEDERSRPEEVIRSILRQLSFTGSNQKVLKQPAAELYELQKEKAIEHGSETVDRLTLQQSVQLLVALLRNSSTVIIIDAIDELKDEERWRLFEAFDEILGEIEDGRVRLFVSSRDNGDIKMKLSKYTNVYIEATDNQDDIQRFVNFEVDKAIACHRLLRGIVPPWLKNEIVTTLIDGAQGM
jgi:NACHT domain